MVLGISLFHPRGAYDELMGFMSRFLTEAEESLPPSVVVDAGVIEGKGMAIIEANPSWGSGLYGCDPAGVLDVIVRGCVRRDCLRAEDERWIPIREY